MIASTSSIPRIIVGSLAVSAIAFGAPHHFPGHEGTTWPTIMELIRNIAASGEELVAFNSQAEQFMQLQALLDGERLRYDGIWVPKSIAAFVPIDSAFQNLSSTLQAAFGMQGPGESVTPLDYHTSRPLLNKVFEALLSYHVSSDYVNLSNQTSDPLAPFNVSINTFLYPLDAFIWRSDTSTQTPSPGLNVTALEQAAKSPAMNLASGIMINDARVLAGFEAENGFLYLIDRVISPLYAFNVSLGGSSDQSVVDSLQSAVGR